MAIPIYQGEFVQARNVLEEIDQPTIEDGCRILADSSDKLNQITKKIEQLKEFCSKEHLMIQGANLEDPIELFQKDTEHFALYISELSTAISSATQRVVNRKQMMYNEEAKKLDKAQASSNGKVA